MGNFRFAMRMLVKEYKKSLFYGLTLVFAIAVTFIFFNIINNDLLKSPDQVIGGSSWQQVQVPFSTVLSFLIICFCCFMIFFANDFFISRKTNEIAIMTLSGNSSFHSTLYLVYQTFTLLFLATPFGIGIGVITAPICNYWMYQYLEIEASIFQIAAMTYLDTILVVAIVLATLSVFACGYIYRNDIAFLLQQEKSMDLTTSNSGTIKPLLCICLYFLGIIMIFMAKHQPSNYVMPVAVGILGMVGTIKYFLPDFVKRFKERYLLEKRYALIYISNLSYSIRRSTLLFALIIAFVTGMLVFIASYHDSPRDYISAIIGYVVVIVLLITSIVYKYCMEVQSRKTFFINLWKIGYTKSELYHIIHREVLYYYLLLLIIPLVYILIIVGRFVYYQEMTLLLALVLVLIYMGSILISGLITALNYRKLVTSFYKGGK
ncbi:FtsX-like permease family protein [Thomasclavelia sp.]|uniref:FtsX-like permease family protein n=1 Tax=Thomasclavelia sp. TaxID=3025757 RepID=UPI0025EA11EF|nr:FtsX-like permease family protein [Thomasclavelia sp.]